jgi:hypothetical protein
MKLTFRTLILAICLLASAGLARARVVDDFSNGKAGWQDFTFVPGFGIPTVADGQMKFTQPAAGQQIFSATQKTSSSYELKDGRTIEFRVDVTETGGEDSIAVLSWIPTGNSPGTLSGYGFAKSTGDILLTKGIERYFVAEDWPPADKPDAPSQNITLVLRLTASGGNVTIHAEVLDKANNNAVLWQKTVVDTPNADVVFPQPDQPVAPFINQSGYFTLFLFQDFDESSPEETYIVSYDNAQAFVMDQTNVDDFNDNNKTGWSDFTFVPGFGLPTEGDGQFRFEQPPAGQEIFSASQKTSRTFDLQEGERLEFHVDVEQTGGQDSFAVLGWIPTSNSAGTLAGYGLAKSTGDILMSKGINRYFTAEDWPPEGMPDAPSENITLVLKLAAENGNVYVTGQILDKSNNNAVLWERTFVDTPNKDAIGPEPEEPLQPFITSGYFTLYLYQAFDQDSPEDSYFVVYDNALAWAPPLPENTAPILTAAQPEEFSNFLPSSAAISFTATDDKDIPDANLSITLNGTEYTTANGLTLSGTGKTRTATLSGKLAENVNYSAVLKATDSDGVSSSQNLYFDTFAKTHFIVELEDYNYAGGFFIDHPVLTAEDPFWFDPVDDASYRNQMGIEGIDFHDTRTTVSSEDTPYRKTDPVRMARTLDSVRDNYTEAGGSAAAMYDYDIADVNQGEWLNYTRTFPAGSYEVYLRESVVNIAVAESVLELVTSSPAEENQTTSVLGSFLGAKSGYKYRTVPLTDGTGLNKVVVRLSGETTLRLRQNTTDPEQTGLRENYLMFVPVEDSGTQRASIVSISPAPSSQVSTLAPTIRVQLQNKETTVKLDSINLVVNGVKVTPQVESSDTGVVLTYPLDPLPVSGASNNAKLTFKDSEDVEIGSDWSFVVNYVSLNPANRAAGTGKDRGFNVRQVQSPSEGGPLGDSLARGEDQLASNSTIPKFVDVTAVYQVINFDDRGDDAGQFMDNVMPPGLEPETNGDDNFAVEVTAYLDLSAGVHHFGVISDDGYKFASGPNFNANSGSLIAFHDGGSANEQFEFLAPQAGLYPIRVVWYERTGDASLELYSKDQETGDLILLNDPDNAKAIKAYTSLNAVVEAPKLTITRNGDQVTITWTTDGALQASDRVDGGYAPVNGAGNKTYTTGLAGTAKFFRVVR